MRRSMAAGSMTSGRSDAAGAAGSTVALESSAGVGCRTVAILHYRLQTLRLPQPAQMGTPRMAGSSLLSTIGYGIRRTESV